MARGARQPGLAMLRCAGASRARTIRLRVRAWRKVRDFLQALHGVPWPATAAQVVDYLEMRAGEPCGRTVPGSILSALAFVEEEYGDRFPRHAGAEEQGRSGTRATPERCIET